MIIALASPKPAASIEDGLARVERLTRDAAGQGARIVCFPEAYLPGLRGQDFEVARWDGKTQAHVLESVAGMARSHAIAIVLSVERITPDGSQIAAAVIDANGRLLGWQSKNQLDPSEDQSYVPGSTRRVFDIDGLRFGIVTCHEGWRYPETVRWAAVRGASVVFHPQHTGSNRHRSIPSEWGAAGGAYYEKAMLCRSRENTIYFASVNYALEAPEAATSLIAPSGECQAWLPYGEEGVLVQPIDVSLATGLLARRYAPDRYEDDRDDAGS
ncbi:MAG TPA: carbon-nitrogen hydrolase family protein [Vicinamibacterales bacterium]|nr:carbon-nitrogen hydrolase family protein [Vicinamibacterales bacterium]